MVLLTIEIFENASIEANAAIYSTFKFHNLVAVLFTNSFAAVQKFPFLL